MGVSIPEAYDYGKVIPQAQTAVTGYKVGDAAVVSDAPAKALGSIGQDAKEIAADTEKWSLSLDSSMAQDALNKLRSARSDLTVGPDGFLKVRGGDVINKKDAAGNTIFESYPQRLQTQYDELTANSNLSVRARRMLDAAATSEITGYKADLARHGLSEAEKYQSAVFVDTKSTLTDRALQNVNEAAAFEQGLADVQTAVRKRAAQLGVPSEAMEKAAVSDVVKFGIMQKIATGDSSAITFFDRYKDKLDPKDSVSIENSIKTMRDQSNAKNWVASNSAGPGPSSEAAKAGVKTSMQHWTADGYSAPVAAGITAGFLRESQFNGSAVNPGDGRDGSDSISIGQWNGARATAFKAFAAANGMDPRDPKAGLAYAKAEIDGVVPYSVSGLSPDFKEKLQAAKSEKEAADIMTRGYFRPLHTEGESAIRQGSASTILAQYDGGPKTHDGLPARQNPDGSISTELSITVTDPRLNGGRATNIPSLWGGKEVSQDEAVTNAINSGKAYQGYDSIDAAVTAAKAKSQAGGANAPAEPTKPASPNSDGIVNARQMLIDIEQRKNDLTSKAQAELSGNLPMLQATLHEIEANYTRQKAGVQLYKDKLYDSVQQHMNTGGVDANGRPTGGPATSVPPANIFSQLTWEQQQSIEKQVERNIAGKKTVTNQQVWYNIQQKLTSNDPTEREMWANAPLFQFKEHLSDSDFQELAKLQSAARKGDPDKEVNRIQTIAKAINDRALTLGIDPTPKPGSAQKAPDSDANKMIQLTRAVHDGIAELEKQKPGHKATYDEIQKVIRDVTYEVGGTSGWFGSNKRAYEVTISNVSTSDRQKITQALTAEGIAPTEENIVARYKRAKLVQPK